MEKKTDLGSSRCKVPAQARRDESRDDRRDDQGQDESDSDSSERSARLEMMRWAVYVVVSALIAVHGLSEGMNSRRGEKGVLARQQPSGTSDGYSWGRARLSALALSISPQRSTNVLATRGGGGVRECQRTQSVGASSHFPKGLQHYTIKTLLRVLKDGNWGACAI